jgi:preprotein translocase subunit SecG
MLVTFVTAVHVFVCVFLILVILLQAGKDAGMGASFGGGGSQTVFGGRGAGSFLGRVTAVCAGVFFVTSLTLSFAASYKPSVTTAFPAEALPVTAAPAGDGGAAGVEAKPGAAAPAGSGTEAAPAADKAAVPPADTSAPAPSAPPAETPQKK